MMIILSKCIAQFISLLVFVVHIRWTVAFQTILFNKLQQPSIVSRSIVQPLICYDNNNNNNKINRNCRYNNAIYDNRHDSTFHHVTSTKLSSTTTPTTSTTTTTTKDGTIKKRILTNEQKMIQILNKYEKIPYGELHDNEEVLLSKCWKALVSTNNNSTIDNKSQIGQRLLLRKIGDYTEFLRRRPQQQSTETEIIETTNVQSLSLNDFIIVLSIWEEYVDKYFIEKNYEAISYALDSVMLLYTKLTNLYQEEITTNYLNVQEVSTTNIKPTIELYQLLFRIFEKSRERNIDKIAYRLLDEMKQKYTIEPNVIIYHSLIVMIAKSKEKNAANRAEQLLMEVITKFPPSINPVTNTITGVTIHSFNIVLTSWAKSSLSYGPERAEKLISYIDTLDAGRNIIQPTVSSFTSLIDAYAQTNEWDSVSHSERIFNKVLDIHLNNNNNNDNTETSTTTNSNSTNYDFEPSIVSWTILMNAYTSLSKRGHRGAASRVNKLLNRMEVLYKDNRISFPPDAIVYITCINANAYSKTIEGAVAAENILKIMYNKYMNDNNNNIDKSNTENNNNKYRPSIRCIKIIIEAYVRVGNIDAGENLLNTYYDNHIQTLLNSNENNNNSNPNWILDVQDIYKTIIFGYCKNNNPIKAHTTLLDMIDHTITPDVYCFDRIIELNTQLMKSDTNNDDTNANANVKIAMKRSYELFELLEECRVQNNNNMIIQPNERVYLSFIRSMIKANIPRKAYKSRLLLRKMYKLYTDDTTNNNFSSSSSIKPTVLTYNAILLACSESISAKEQQQNDEPSLESVEALKIAVEIFNEITDKETVQVVPNIGPDHVSFGNMLRCCNLLPDDSIEKNTLIVSTFQLCCQYGLVNEFVIRDLQLVASTTLLQNMFGNAIVDINNITIDDLPQSWTKHTQQRLACKKNVNNKERNTKNSYR